MHTGNLLGVQKPAEHHALLLRCDCSGRKQGGLPQPWKLTWVHDISANNQEVWERCKDLLLKGR
jgi:hypothetical protein